MKAVFRCAIVAALLPQVAVAQLTDLPAGIRVRGSWSTPARPFDGITLAPLGDTALLVRSGRLPLQIPRTSIHTLQIYRGKDPWAGARRGALLGAGIFVVSGLTWARPSDAFYECYGRDPCDRPSSTSDFVSGALFSTMSGAVIGAFVGRDKWQQLIPAAAAQGAPLSTRAGPGHVPVRPEAVVPSPPDRDTLAQEPTKRSIAQLLTMGSQVRVASNVVMGPTRGRVVALDDGVLTLLVDGAGVVKIPVSSISALELHLGKQRHTLHGFVIGTAIGIGVGLGVNLDRSSNCSDNSDSFCSRGEALAVAGITYAGLGALVGWLVTTDRWGAVTLGALPSQARPGRLSPALGLKVSF